MDSVAISPPGDAPATLAFGPTLLGVAHDPTGGYNASIGLCIALLLIGAVTVLSARSRFNT
jgi:cyanate permease